MNSFTSWQCLPWRNVRDHQLSWRSGSSSIARDGDGPARMLGGGGAFAIRPRGWPWARKRGCPRSTFETAPWLEQNGGCQPPLSVCSRFHGEKSWKQFTPAPPADGRRRPTREWVAQGAIRPTGGSLRRLADPTMGHRPWSPSQAVAASGATPASSQLEALRKLATLHGSMSKGYPCILGSRRASVSSRLLV